MLALGVVNWFHEAWVVALLSVVACGGSSRHGPSGTPDDDGGEGGASSSGAGEGGHAGSPMKDGVPIGDCRETGETRPAECPAQPPEDQTSCAAPDGLLSCPYDIRVANGRASQAVYFCHPDQLQWGSALLSCGVLCDPPAEHVLDLGGAECEARATSPCESGTIFAFATEQQVFDSAFESVIQSCLGEVIGTRYQLEVRNGCPARISSSQPFSEPATQCLRGRLGSLRWSCALDLSCSAYQRVLL